MPHTRKSFLENGRTQADPCPALYLHVPICRRRCSYCDFCSVVCDDNVAARITHALLAELGCRAPALRRPLSTAFVGGGTPTALPPELLRALLAAVTSRGGAPDEFTVEANPATLDDRTLGILIDAGVNRISIGAQSFANEELAILGRTHDAPQAHEAISGAIGAGVADVSVDLIYGIPGQTLQTWRRTLQQATEWPIQHISCYCLSCPDGTPIATSIAGGQLQPMDEDLQRDCYELAIDLLESIGLIQYEISNFATEGHLCKHNLTYWENRPYVGVGPSAVSYLAGTRAANIDSIEQYIRQIEWAGPTTASSEHLVGGALMAETLMLALRLRKGCEIKHFRDVFGVDPLDVFGRSLRKAQETGLLTLDNGRLALTRRGLFVSDGLFADLFAEAESPEG